MHLQAGEYIYKTYYKHPTPYVFLILKTFLAFVPFYFLWAVFLGFFETGASSITFLVLVFFSVIVLGYVTFTYYFDKLILTNYRLLHIDWVNLFVRDQTAAEFSDIQRIYTRENGVLAKFYIFDYGTINIETASATVTIRFANAPDPEHMKKFISDYMLLHKNDKKKYNSEHNIAQGNQA